MHLENNCKLLQYLQDHGVELFIFVQLFSTCQYSRGLSCSWRSIEEQMRQSFFTDELLNCGRNRKRLVNSFIQKFQEHTGYLQNIQQWMQKYHKSNPYNFWNIYLSHLKPYSIKYDINSIKIKQKFNMDATEFSFWVNKSQRLSCILALQGKSQFVNERVQFIIH